MIFQVVFLVIGCQVAASLQASDSTFPGNKHTNPLWESTWTDKLKQDILLHYDKFARPAQSGNKTSVNLEVTLRHIELDENRAIMTIHCWVHMTWIDEKLKWNVSHYNGLKELHLAEHEVWQPDIFPYNSATGSTIDHYGNTNLIVLNNGTVIWVPPSIFEVFCQLDFTRWPFDSQTCSVKVGSWTYNGEQIDLYNPYTTQTVYNMPELIPNAEWEFVKMTIERNTVFYPCCSIPYVDLTFDLTIQRHSATYKALFVTPASVIILLTLASFWLPPASGDKITLVGAAVIITCLFSLYFMQKMPAMAGTTPSIVTFYTRCLCLVTVAVLVSVFVINLAKNPKLSSLPWTLKKSLRGWLGKCLLLNVSEDKNFSKAEEMTDSQPVLPEQVRHTSDTNSKIHQEDWVLLATAVDRIFFLIYCFTFVIMAAIYSA